MKKLFNRSLLLTFSVCLALVVALCGCGETGDVLSSTDASSNVSETSTEATSTQAQTSQQSETSKVSSEVSKNQTSSAVSKPSTSSKTASSKPVTSSAPEKTPAQKIVGKWRGSVDMAPLLAEQGIAVEGEQIVSCDVEYTAGGVIYEVIDRTKLKTTFTNIFNKVLTDSLAKDNMTKEQFESQAKMTFEEYLAQTVQVSMDMVPQTVMSTYKFEGNELYVRDQDDTDFVKTQYSFSGENKLTIVEEGVSITYTRIA